MGRVNVEDVYNYPDDDIVRWVYLPATNTVAETPFAAKTHFQILYDQGFQAADRKNVEWWGGYYVPKSGQLNIHWYPEDNGVDETVTPDQVEQAVRAHFERVSSWKLSDDAVVTDTPADVSTNPVVPSDYGTTLKILPDKHLVRLYNISYPWINSSHPHKRRMRRLIHDEMHRRVYRDKNNRLTSIDDGSCPICRHTLDTGAGGYAYCSNCGWYPFDDTLPNETFNSEEYLGERDHPDYLADPGFPTYLQHVGNKLNYDQRTALTQHVEDLGKQHNVSIEWRDQPWNYSSFMRGRNQVSHEVYPSAVYVPHLKSDLDYAAALHEIGHGAYRHEYDPTNQYWDNSSAEEELYAHHFALEHSQIPWDEDTLEQIKNAMGTYWHQAQQGAVDVQSPAGSNWIMNHDLPEDPDYYREPYSDQDARKSKQEQYDHYIDTYVMPTFFNSSHIAKIWNVQSIDNPGFAGLSGPGAMGRPFITDGESLWVGNNSSGHIQLIYAINNPEQRELAEDAYGRHMGRGQVSKEEYFSAASGYYNGGEINGVLGNPDLAKQALPFLRQLYGDERGIDPPLTARTTKVEELPAEFDPHSHDDNTRRTFVYLAPSDTLYLAPNNAYHQDIEFWLYHNRPDEWKQMWNEHGNFLDENEAKGLIERNYEDHALDVRMYYAEGLERLPDHIMTELENYFGERMYQSDWVYPREPDPFDRYDPELDYDSMYPPTQQYPSGWSAEEGIISSWLKTAADVRELAARAYDQIMNRPDVLKVYDLAQEYEDKWTKTFEGQGTRNFGQMMPYKPDAGEEAQQFMKAQNAHVLADAIQSAISNMRNQYPGSYKLMPNAVKTLKTWAAEAENQSGEGMNVQWNRDPGRHVGDIYGQAGELLQRLRQQNRVPEGMDVNRMNFEDLQDWLYSFNENENNESGYRTNNSVYDLGNGWHIVRITDDEDLAQEGRLMGHCVGGYCERVQVGRSLIYSLRDPKNMPHATIEIRGQSDVAPLSPAEQQGYEDERRVPTDWSVVQIQGKSNSEPIPEYQQMIKQWFEYLQDQEGVRFEPMSENDIVEYVQDAEELMSWYEEHGNDSPADPNTNRDKYGLPASGDSNSNGFEFEWSTLIQYCVDNVLHHDVQQLRAYNYGVNSYTPQELVTALTAAADRAKLPADERTKLVEMAESELLEVENKVDDNNHDYYFDTAKADWEFHHPDEEPDYEHEDWMQYEQEAQNEVYNEYFSEANEFIQLLAKAFIGQGSFGAQSKTKVIYV